MGQAILCGSAADHSFSSDRLTIIQTFRNTDLRGQHSFINVCKEFGIGQYMQHDQYDKVDRMWKELYGITQILRIQQQDYDCEELKQDIRHKYAFVVNGQDEIITQLWILDKHGFNYIVSLGPPAEYRWSCWKVLLLSKRALNIVYEDKLCEINESSRQIGLDVERTLITHQFFKQELIGKHQLLRMLNAISLSFPKLGYCQGMNFLTGFLLMISGCDERLGFECFLQLLLHPKYLLYFLFCEKLPFLHLLSYFVHQQLRQFDPEIYQHLRSEQIPDSFWLTKMMLSLFLYVLPTNQCIRVWDYIISYGFVAIIELVLGMVKTMRTDLLKADIEKMGAIFQGQLNRKEVDVEQTISLARNEFSLTRKRVTELTKGFLQERKDYDRTSSEYRFWLIFLEFNNKQSFNNKMTQFIRQQEL